MDGTYDRWDPAEPPVGAQDGMPLTPTVTDDDYVVVAEPRNSGLDGGAITDGTVITEVVSPALAVPFADEYEESVEDKGGTFGRPY